MKTVVLDIETIPDEAAIARAGYQPDGEYMPWTLQEIACASMLVVEGTSAQSHLYRIASHSRAAVGERGIVATVERELADANEFVTYNGLAHDLPILLARGVLAEVAMPTIQRLATRTPPARHTDLLRDLTANGAPRVTLAQVCAPLAIPIKPDRHARVADHAAAGRWDAIERYCEQDVVATWAAALAWRSTTDPDTAQQRRLEFAAWIGGDQPRLAHLLPFADPSAWAHAGGNLGDADAIVF